MTPFSIIIISCLGIIVYANSFLCSFQYDDKIYIIDNLAIRNIHDLLSIWKYCPCRFITFLSLGFNYHFHQLNVFGYHLFNLAVHLASAVLVSWLTILTLTTPVMKENEITRHARLIALFTGLVFVSHPVQTEAVTYIWQRTASMACLFYLASLCLYVKSRMMPSSRGRLYYILSLVAAVLAMFTKETAVTLPLIILLYEYSFLKTQKNLNWKGLTPFLLTLFIIPLTMLITASLNPQQMRGSAPEVASNIPPLHYLLTQFRVIITYIRLAFLPLNQNLDYDYPVYRNIFEMPVLISFLSLTAILYSAKRLFSKYRLVSFSIFWFFLTLLPESSLLPLQDVIFEHRLYLPLAGYSMFLVSGTYYLFGKNNLKAVVKIMILVIGCYSVLTYQRNSVWKNEFTLWDDTVRKSPHKERPYNNRGLVLSRQGNPAQAIADYTKAIEINPRYTNAYINRGFMYSKEGNFLSALSDDSKAIEINPKLAEAYINRGNVYDKQGDFTHALSDYDKAIEINPQNAEAYNNRGNIFYKQGNWIRAVSDYDKAVSLKTDNADAYYNLGYINYKQGHWAQAVSNYSKAIAINPKDTESYNNRAISYYQLKEYDKAWSDVEKIEKEGFSVNPQLIQLLKQIRPK